MKNKYIAALLAIFLGWLGFHKFYLGKWIQGFLYIIFMPITVFIAILEGIVYLINTEEWFDINFNAEYIRNQEQIERIRMKRERVEQMNNTMRNKSMK